MSPRLDVLTGPAVLPHLDALAALRIAVFRDWPYLYDGDMGYERDYLAAYARPGAMVAGAFDGDRMVGAATAAPMAQHHDEFAAALAGHDVGAIWYLAESVLLPDYRGHGVGHAFFDLREAEGRRQGFAVAAFCAVTRPDDHPARPAGARDLAPFWRARGYAPVPGAVARFAWRDVGMDAETAKPLQFWMRAL